MTSHDNLFDVPDATDWNNTLLSGFVAVESPMRCQVCKEFIKTPMITSCGHTFCSECIRRSLSHNGLCPACRSPDQELKLRANKSMEEVVEAFQKTREQALEVARAKRIEDSTPSRKRRKMSPAEGSAEPSRRTRTLGRISSRATPQSTLDGGVDVDLAIESDEDYKPDDGLVPCPVCDERMKEAVVNKHMDDVHFNPAPARQSTTLSSFTTQSPAPKQSTNKPPPDFHPKPLPTISYSLLKDKALREKLYSLGIPAHGTRPLMERRHREWMTLWNANCDATKPKSKKELLKQLDEWERTQAYPAVHRGPKESHIGNKEFDGREWASQHAEEFGSLVDKARKQGAERRAKEKAAAEETPTEEANAATSREEQGMEPLARRMGQEVYVNGGMEEQAQSDKVSAVPQINQGISADMNSTPQDQPPTELDTWWMKEMAADAAAPVSHQSQNLAFSGAQRVPQPPYQPAQDHPWNGAHPIPQDDAGAWPGNEYCFTQQSNATHQNIDPSLGVNGPALFNFENFKQETLRPGQANNECQQLGDMVEANRQNPRAAQPSALPPPSARAPPPSSQPQYQQQRHQLPSSQPPQTSPRQQSPYQAISPSSANHSPNNQPPTSGQQQSWQDPNTNTQLRSMPQHGDMRNRDGSAMTAQQRLEILNRPYKRTGSEST